MLERPGGARGRHVRGAVPALGGALPRWRLVPGASVQAGGRYSGGWRCGRATVSVKGTQHTFDIVGTASTQSLYSGGEGLVVPVPPEGSGVAAVWGPFETP